MAVTARKREEPRAQQPGIGQFLRDVYDELRKVVWPTPGELYRYTLVVIFTGYTLVGMEMSSESWFVVRNPPGVTSCVGSANSAVPLEERGSGDPEADEARGPEDPGRVPGRRVGAGGGRSIHRLPRQGRRDQPGEGQAQGAGQHVRPRDAGRARPSSSRKIPLARHIERYGQEEGPRGVEAQVAGRTG